MASVAGSQYNDTVYVGSGSTWKNGKKTGSLTSSTDSADIINTGNGQDLIYAGGGNDVISAGNGVDTVDGGEGDDRIWGDAQNALDTSNGGDLLFGEGGNDTIYGGNGKDSISGGADNDMLFGENGDDTINGGDGDDTIRGGNGGDTLYGGTGADRFVYEQNADSPVTGGWDRIYDFSGMGGQGDKIDLTAFRPDDDLEWRGDTGAGAWGVWYEPGGIGYFIYADTNGDGVADLKIEVNSLDEPGANDFLGVKTPPIIVTASVDDAGGVTEDTPDENAVTLSDSGGIVFYDGDISNPHDISYTADAGNTLGGTLSFSADPVDVDSNGDGSFDWIYSVDNAAVQDLGAGDTATEKFTITIEDADGLSVDQEITVTVTGVNDEAVITETDGSNGAVTEAGGDANGTPGDADAGGDLDVSDVDQGEGSFVAAVPGDLQGTYGTFTFDETDGTWTYTLDDSDEDTQALNEGDSETDTLTVYTDDGTSHDIEVTVNGKNDEAVITEGAASPDNAVAEAGGDANDTAGDPDASGDLAVSDVDDGESEFDTADDGPHAGTYGTFTFNAADGTWSYALDDDNTDTQKLNGGDSATDSLTIHSKDGTAYTIEVTVTGANDDAVITEGAAPADTVVTEAGGDANGTAGDLGAGGDLDVSDVDDGESEFDAADDGTHAGTYGTFTFTATDGTWSYVLDDSDDDTQKLNGGDSETDSLTIHSKDGTAYTIEVTVTGANDDAVITEGAAPADTVVTEDSGSDTTAGGDLDVADVDDGESSFQAVTGGALAGTYGDFTFDETNGIWTYTIDNARAGFATLDTGETDTDTLTVYSDDGTDYTISVTVNGANDGDPNDFDTAGPGPGTTVSASPSSADASQTFVGTNGAETINAAGGDDTIYGYGGNDHLNGQTNVDVIYGGAGNDTIEGHEGGDMIYGGSGNDFIYGYLSNQETTNGNPDGGDLIYGGSGNDYIQGNAANDTIYGGIGNDTIIGSAGADSVSGGAGADVFAFLTVPDTGNTIVDFVSGTDKLDLSGIDANTAGGNPGKQAFGVLNNSSTLTANQVSWYTTGGNVIVIADTDGNTATTEFSVTLTGITSISSTDVIL